MEKEKKIKSSPPITTFKKYKSGTVDKLIRHNFRIKIPENVKLDMLEKSPLEPNKLIALSSDILRILRFWLPVNKGDILNTSFIYNNNFLKLLLF
ncbi:hypothetical protein [Spiroplasma endosymbiont of Villa modesta]|uniref:hypothetical protein n=1 Tax=Spiroplasma endosymbiont of Villa modesta TaxID=3066293 RepID=UPI00313AEDB7